MSHMEVNQWGIARERCFKKRRYSFLPCCKKVVVDKLQGKRLAYPLNTKYMHHSLNHKNFKAF